jgi:predicted ribosome quality control (RQC) complex YloA/Tae2 family protein
MKTFDIYIEENNKTYTLFIGRSAKENDQLVRSASQDDLWFHLDGDISSPHFVLASGGDNIPKRYINQIAALFRDYKSGLARRYNVIYTPIKNVKVTKVLGTVILRNFQVVKV